MLAKKVWIPILIVLLAVVFSGLLYSQKSHQDAVRIITPVEAKQSTAQKSPPPGETAESGHWHGDEWHAVDHTESSKASRDSLQKAMHYVLFPKTTTSPTDKKFREVYGNIADLPEETDFDIEVKGYVSKHFEKYPDCDDYDAVLSDAKLSARWYLADMEQRKKEEALYEEGKQIDTEIQFIFRGGDAAFQARVNSMSEEDKLSLRRELNALLERNLQLDERRKALIQKRPVYPKMIHKHE